MKVATRRKPYAAAVDVNEVGVSLALAEQSG